MATGFLGLGVMGGPMAMNLCRHGHELVVWTRTIAKAEPLRTAGAAVAPHAAEVFARVGDGGAVIIMLFDEAATDATLCRGTPAFDDMIRGRTIINMSSVAPEYSRALARDVEAAGGRFVESPVSGSRIPAEGGQLLAMTAGDAQVCEDVRALLQPMCREIVYCGAVGNGMLMKLAINIFMLTSAAGLAEAFHFASRCGLPLEQFQALADASQMSSQLSRIKLAKLRTNDFARQGAVLDGVNNTRLITDEAARVGASVSLITEVRRLFDAALSLGHGSDDMIAVIRAIEANARESSN
jgi:3-hydroxyisobutyrate dehydrogenase